MGIGNHLAFENRAYDSRTGRWYSLDPLATKYPWLSPFNFAGNNPIYFVDPDGKVITGFTLMGQTANPYKLATQIISSSKVFINFLSQYVSMSQGDNLGNTKEGMRPWLNVNFENYSDNVVENPPHTDIQVLDGKKWVSISAFNGTLTAKDISRLRVSVTLTSDHEMSTGEKL